MDFEFDEDQRLLQQLVRETVAKARSLPEDQLWATFQELGWLAAEPVELATETCSDPSAAGWRRSVTAIV